MREKYIVSPFWATVAQWSALECGQTQTMPYFASYLWWAERLCHVLVLALNYAKSSLAQKLQIKILIVRQRFGS